VFAEAFGLCVFAEKLPGIFAGRHLFSLRDSTWEFNTEDTQPRPVAWLQPVSAIPRWMAHRLKPML
jgi:hypothetical protein